jgi:putative endonuclease
LAGNICIDISDAILNETNRVLRRQIPVGRLQLLSIIISNHVWPTETLKTSQLLWKKLSEAARHFKRRRVLSADAALGRRGEDLAHRYLRCAGFKIIARNNHSGGSSDIDIVARDGDITVFVEVKTRAAAEYGAPERATDSEKQKRIVRAARSYAACAGIEWSTVRFDTVSIVFSQSPAIVHQQDAFFEERAI